MKFHLMKKVDDEWDYFFKKEDFPGKRRNDLAQKDQTYARANARTISKRKDIGEIGIMYNGEIVDIYVNGKRIQERLVQTREKRKPEGI
jgi:spermidine/putrescine-binding protein